MPSHIILADDHSLVREGVKRMLDSESDLVVTGEAESVSQLLDLLHTVPADLLLLDINMPGRSGLDVLGQLRVEFPDLRILILSMYPEDSTALHALRAGAAGYISKAAASEELLSAIHRVLAGKTYVSSKTADMLVTEIRSSSEIGSHASLSVREFEVFKKLAEGCSLKEIAEILCVSVPTVSTYRGRIMEKMMFKNNAELIRYALQHRLIE